MQLYIDETNHVVILGYPPNMFTDEEVNEKVTDLTSIYNRYDVIALPITDAYKL